MYAGARPNSPGMFTENIPPQCSGCLATPFSFLLVTYRVSNLEPPKVQQTGMLTGSFTCKHRLSLFSSPKMALPGFDFQLTSRLVSSRLWLASRSVKWWRSGSGMVLKKFSHGVLIPCSCGRSEGPERSWRPLKRSHPRNFFACL